MIITMLRTGVYINVDGEGKELELGPVEIDKEQGEKLVARGFAEKGDVKPKFKSDSKKDKIIESLKVQIEDLKAHIDELTKPKEPDKK